MSGSSTAFPRKSSVIEGPSLSQTSCGDSVSSLGSKLQPLQPTTHKLTARPNESTRKSNSSFNSSSINNRTTGTNGFPSLSSPTMTGYMLQHNPPHSDSTLVRILNWDSNQSKSPGW